MAVPEQVVGGVARGRSLSEVLTLRRRDLGAQLRVYRLMLGESCARKDLIQCSVAGVSCQGIWCQVCCKDLGCSEYAQARRDILVRDSASQLGTCLAEAYAVLDFRHFSAH